MKLIIKTFIFTLLIIFIFSFNVSGEEKFNSKKTIMIFIDKMDFNTIDDLDIKDSGIGIINMRTEKLYKKGGEESFFMSIATGRRQYITKGRFKGVDRSEDGSLSVLGYDDIINDIKNGNKGLGKNVSTLSSLLISYGKNTGYIGNDITSILAADSNGLIKYGNNLVNYNKEWLINESNSILQKVDLLILSININDSNRRIDLFKNYIEEFKGNNIIIIPKSLSRDFEIKFNNTLYPIIYISNGHGGLLTSNTTRRRGIITNLDIMPHILKLNDIRYESIGSYIRLLPSQNPTYEVSKILENTLSINIIKNILHFIVIFTQLFIIYIMIFKRKKDYPRVNVMMDSLLIGILLSFIFSFVDITRFTTLYLILLILSSVLSSILLNYSNINLLPIVSLLTYIIILYGVFINNKILYNSYLGYNNILVGGRFYGLNNSIMGVLLVTSIISYFNILRYIKTRYLKPLLAIIIFPINILAFSSIYGSNVGGYLTSIALLLIILYFIVFGKSIRKREVLLLFIIIAVGIFINIYMDLNSATVSHLGKAVLRIKSLGIYELINMVTIKIKQLLFMLIVPPWSIIFASQVIILYKYYKNEDILFNRIKDKYPYIIDILKISLITGVIGLLINDTGVISFVYIITYLISLIFSVESKRENILQIN